VVFSRVLKWLIDAINKDIPAIAESLIDSQNNSIGLNDIRSKPYLPAHRGPTVESGAGNIPGVEGSTGHQPGENGKTNLPLKTIKIKPAEPVRIEPPQFGAPSQGVFI
jgi:hypothetical protein